MATKKKSLPPKGADPTNKAILPAKGGEGYGL